MNHGHDEESGLESAAAELTAAMVVSDAGALDALPPALAERVIRAGESLVRTQARVAPVATAKLPSPRNTVMAWSGWFAAAAALLLWFAPPRSPDTVSATGTANVRPENSVAVLRSTLLSGDSTTQRLDWTATADSAARGASGDVVWSARAQRGVMRLAGLQPNDRRRWQYQLWIFDKTRDQKYPVDGGVFDIPPGQSEVLVAIDARVPVGDAVMFAVTVEPAGGVVVSTRERIALLAQRGA
jgi:hypothetical protein